MRSRSLMSASSELDMEAPLHDLGDPFFITLYNAVLPTRLAPG
jgi:hypothetical protein